MDLMARIAALTDDQLQIVAQRDDASGVLAEFQLALLRGLPPPERTAAVICDGYVIVAHNGVVERIPTTVMQKIITHGDEGYCVMSEDGQHRFGCYPTLAEAQARLLQIHSFREAAGLREGSFVSWNSSGGRARGQIEHVMREGVLGVPDSEFSIIAEPDDPAVLIRVWRETAEGWQGTETLVGHKMSTLTAIDALKQDSYAPPEGVQEAAQRALRWIEEGHAGSGFTDVGRARAAQLARGDNVSRETIGRMSSFFARHAVDSQATGWNQGEEGFPTPGRVAWDAWGGDAGRTWSQSIMETQKNGGVPLQPVQNALYEAYEAIAEAYGKFDVSSGPHGAHYMGPENNPFASHGLRCANCVFFEGGGGCEIVNALVHPDGVCKLWIIPERWVTKASKTEDGEQYPAEAYAYVPDPDMPSTWKLRLWDSPSDKVTAAQVGRAIAALGPGGFRGQRVEIPSEDLPQVKDKIRQAWLSVHDDPEMMPRILKGGSQGFLQKEDARRFTLGPLYVPDFMDAHGEWTDANELQKAVWDWVKSGDRSIYLQHDRSMRAGEWVEVMTMPQAWTVTMVDAQGNPLGDATYPPGTVFLGVQWDEPAWEMVKQNKLRGYSIGGLADRLMVDLPTEAAREGVEMAKREPVAKHPGHPDQSVHNPHGGGGGETPPPAPATTFVSPPSGGTLAQAAEMIERGDTRRPLPRDSAGRVINPDATGGYKAGIPEEVEFRGEMVTPEHGLWHHLESDGMGGYQITAERAALHDEIVSKATESVPASDDPTYYMLGGGPAAGKTSAIESGLAAVPGRDKAVLVNADEVKDSLPEYDRMRMSDNVDDFFNAASFNHSESSVIAKEIQMAALAGGQDIVLDGTGDGSIGSVESKVQAARMNGYRVNAIYATVPTEEAVGRSMRRSLNPDERRFVPEAVVRGTHADVSRVFPQAVGRGLFDSAVLIDTTTRGSAVLIGETVNGVFEVRDEGRYAEFLAKGDV